MSSNANIVAQIAEDLFYQDFRPDDGFWRKEHFVMLCIAADAFIKKEEFDRQVNNNLRKRTPHAPIVLGSDNYQTVKVKVEKGKAALANPIMMFPGTEASLSVPMVTADGKCSHIMPISIAQKWMVCDDKTTVYWHPSTDGEGCSGIELINWEICHPKELTVTYVSQLSGTSVIQESRKFAIWSMVTNFMKVAKDGVVVDMSNDSNPNTSPQTEINNHLFKALRQ